MVRMAKVILFNDQMSSVLLLRGAMLEPFTIELNELGNVWMQVREAMYNLADMNPINQPPWHLVRVEKFSQALMEVNIFFAQLPLHEFNNIATRIGAVVLPAKNLGPGPITARLRYLIPMCIVLSKMPKEQWPHP